METQARTAKPLHPLSWVAGIAMIVFSAVGIGAFMGWIPNSMSESGDKLALEAQPAARSPTPQPYAPAAPALKEPSVTRAAPVARAAPVPQSAPFSAPAPVAQTSAPTPAAGRAQASIACAECGVIESVHAVESKGSGTGLGAVGGAVAGGLVGSQIGGGRGKDLMTVVGAVGGAVAGNEVEKRVKSTTSYSITVRMNDGSSRVISEANAPTWRTGDKVRLVNGAIQSNA